MNRLGEIAVTEKRFTRFGGAEMLISAMETMDFGVFVTSMPSAWDRR